MSEEVEAMLLGEVREWEVEWKRMRRQRDELAIALRVYLYAGTKETRTAASVIAKAALAKVTP